MTWIALVGPELEENLSLRYLASSLQSAGFEARIIRFDGDEPYTVIPPCELGRSARAISHELAEMSTDPIVGTGWLSDSDANLGIGEIADLCNREVTTPIAGFAVTQLWSNRDSDCRPKP